jgi:two-component system response regulator HydG
MRSDVTELIGTSSEMQELREEIARISASEAKVLITGETGVGKELVARAIHTSSRRASGPFVAMNCAGMPESLLETELFGHVRGSFTDAYRDKAGTLEIADRGTVFLDEVGDMTLRMQGLLLRFLETGEVHKVGSDLMGRRVDVRVIAATNRDLRSLVDEGRFRDDLFYRLNVIHLVVPPLRARRSDIPLLADHFLARCRRLRPAVRNGADEAADLAAVSLAPEVIAALATYPWPGNVRELQNAIERIVVKARHPAAGLDDLPPEIRHHGSHALRPVRERRRTAADELYERIKGDGESFWTAVYPLYMRREITRDTVRVLVTKALQESRGNYRIVARLFNLQSGDYKRFLNFLRKHNCQVPFKEYRQ